MPLQGPRLAQRPPFTLTAGLLPVQPSWASSTARRQLGALRDVSLSVTTDALLLAGCHVPTNKSLVDGEDHRVVCTLTAQGSGRIDGSGGPSRT